MEWTERTRTRGVCVYLNGLGFDAVKERVKKKKVDSSQFPLHLQESSRLTTVSVARDHLDYSH